MPQTGTLQWIGLRPAKKETLQSVTLAEVNTKNGLTGDRYKSAGKRMITLIQEEHLLAVGSILGKSGPIDPLLTRRNLVVKGINLLALKGAKFQIGEEVILEYTSPCHPCTRMEENFGPGGLNAMRGHGGICVKVIEGGTINVGDEVKMVTENPTSA
jgi:MOSC domain-containing protein YiiM